MSPDLPRHGAAAAALVAAIAGLTAPAGASDRAGADASGIAAAAIIQPITVAALEDLSFGTVAIGPAAGGTITVDPHTGSVAYAGAVDGVCTHGDCPARPAVFGVSGEPGRRYRIGAPTASSAAPVSGHGPSLPVSDLTVAVASLPGDAPVGLLDAGGRDSFRMGGTLQLPAGTAAGLYRAELSVVVSYD